MTFLFYMGVTDDHNHVCHGIKNRSMTTIGINTFEFYVSCNLVLIVKLNMVI